MAVNNQVFHKTVLLQEVIQYLNIKPGEVYIDCTVGGTGHASAILKKGGRVYGLDCDPEAIKFSKEYLQIAYPNASWQIIQANFANLAKIAKQYAIPNPAGILFDLGASRHQFKTASRGFSFFTNEPLDMRMDPKLQVTAEDLVNGLHKGELTELFLKLGEEKLARFIASNIVTQRSVKPIKTTKVLADIVTRIYEKYYLSKSKIHPATKVFQALRICVNDELNNLKEVLPQAVKLLKKEGRLVVISFHSLEDKIVKDFFKQGEEEKWLNIITKKPVIPCTREMAANFCSRSAKLRCAKKI